ncbi:hypothetical protein, partial [Aeromonas caviae]
MKPVVHGFGINPEGEGTTVNQRLVVLRPVGDGVKRRAHDAYLKGMVVIRSPSLQLVPQAASIWETTPFIMSHQLTFADSEFSSKRRQTRKEI